MAQPYKDEDTSARWEPIPDEEWAMGEAVPEPASDTAAERAVRRNVTPQLALEVMLFEIRKTLCR